MTELTIEQLTRELIAWDREESYPAREEAPLWRWQRWMRETPEHAWQVLQALVTQAADDPEVMDHAARQGRLLVAHDFERFCPRFAALLPQSPLLASMLGPEAFVRGHYGPRYRTLDELASVLVRHDRFAALSHQLEDLIREDHQQGLRAVLEIIRRAPRYGMDADEIDLPLFHLLRAHGPLVIAGIEDAARDSVAVRRAIWALRRFNGGGEPRVPTDLWDRFQAAAAGTTTWNTERPVATSTEVGPELEGLLSHWFLAQETFWAYMEGGSIVHKDPERGWALILRLVHHAESRQGRCNIGCGPLEDLIRNDPALFVERVEAEVVHNQAFADALACVWLTLEDVPEALARRYYVASGKRLAVLDAPAGWGEECGEGDGGK